jgi:hypothetical protein
VNADYLGRSPCRNIRPPEAKPSAVASQHLTSCSASLTSLASTPR